MRSAPRRKHSVLVLLSGGVDSSTVCLYLHERRFDVHPHFVFYGQRAAASEWKATRAIARHLKIATPTFTELSSLGKSLTFPLVRGFHQPAGVTFAERLEESFLPHRNLLLATCAAMIAASRGIPAIALGIVGGGDVAYPDVTLSFLRRLRGLLRMSAKVRVFAPFATKTKQDVARFGWERAFDYGLTYSCHRQSRIHCGRCVGCIERNSALTEYPPPTPTAYALPLRYEA